MSNLEAFRKRVFADRRRDKAEQQAKQAALALIRKRAAEAAREEKAKEDCKAIIKALAARR